MSTTPRRMPPKTTRLIRDWMTVDEAANYIGVHPKTVRKWYRTGRLPAYRVAGSPAVRIDRADLDAVTMTRYTPGGVA